MPRLSVRHLTRYRYRRPVSFGEHRMRLRPLESYDQRLLGARLTITPRPACLHNIHDVFGNCVSIARFAAPADTLVFESRVSLDHTPVGVANEADDLVAGAAAGLPFAYAPEDLPDLARCIERAHPDPERTLEGWARRFAPSPGRRGGAIAALTAMTHAIHGDFRYAARLAVGVQPPLETLRLGEGSCRDFAVLMIEAARVLGLAARFVSGYVYDHRLAGAPPVRRGGGHTHAWVQAYLPGRGWAQFDPTNGIVGGTDLVRVAVARDPVQALPLHGTWFGSMEDYLGMDVEVDVEVEGAPSRLALAG